MLLGDGHGVKDGGIDLVGLDIDEIHLFTNTLKRGFGAKLGHICTDETVGLFRDGFEIDVLGKLHVLGVDSQDFQTTDFVWNSDIDFTIESTETTEGTVDGVWSVGGTDDNNLTSTLETVHKSEELTDDTSFDLTGHFVSLGGNGINFIDEDNGRGVLLGFFECLSEVAFGLTSHLRHNFWAIDQEEECTGFVRDGTSDEGLARTWRAVQEDTTWWFDTECFEQGWMSEWKFDHFTNEGELLSATTDIIVSDVVLLVLIFTFDRLSFCEKDGGWDNDTEFLWLTSNDFEFDWFERPTDHECIVLLEWSVRVSEVWNEVCRCDITSETLDAVVEGKDVDFGEVWAFGAWKNGDEIAETDSEVLSDHLVHPDLGVVKLVVDEGDGDGELTSLASEGDVVSLEDFELVHLGLGHLDCGVVVLLGFLDQ